MMKTTTHANHDRTKHQYDNTINVENAFNSADSIAALVRKELTSSASISSYIMASSESFKLPGFVFGSKQSYKVDQTEACSNNKSIREGEMTESPDSKSGPWLRSASSAFTTAVDLKSSPSERILVPTRNGCSNSSTDRKIDPIEVATTSSSVKIFNDEHHLFSSRDWMPIDDASKAIDDNIIAMYFRTVPSNEAQQFLGKRGEMPKEPSEPNGSNTSTANSSRTNWRSLYEDNLPPALPSKPEPIHADERPERQERTDWKSIYNDSLPPKPTAAVASVPSESHDHAPQQLQQQQQQQGADHWQNSHHEEHQATTAHTPALTAQPEPMEQLLALDLQESSPASAAVAAVAEGEPASKQSPPRKASQPSTTKRKYRSKRRKRPNYDPAEKVFVEPRDQDVLFGRGGRSNHHPGNKVYHAEKEKIQPRYLAATKEAKTDISQELVDLVHARGGRFLKLEDGTLDKWYEVLDIAARKKVSQALRELNTPEHRQQKRARYAK